MINYVGIPPILRIALRVAMATMHFQIAQSGLFFRNIIFWHLGGPNNLASKINYHWDAR